ncbi:MAG: hypothetical protein QOK02_6250 [Mycobacterium sp.]|nr:hypothetical protein [Mycobacterium sp.]
MNLWNWLTRTRPDHGWPAYLINGRIRTSTVGLIVAFLAIAWVHNTYQPAPAPPVVPETAVVPPGFVPDPEYTWVPRTNVQERPSTTTTTPTTTTTTTTAPSPTETTSTSPTSPTSPTTPVPATVDPDGAGPIPPQTLTPITLPTVVLPTAPGPGPAPATPAPPR